VLEAVIDERNEMRDDHMNVKVKINISEEVGHVNN